jgi:hypothetical protein
MLLKGTIKCTSEENPSHIIVNAFYIELKLFFEKFSSFPRDILKIIYTVLVGLG